MNDGRDAQTYAIIGAAMEVHSALGHGFLEAVYQEALAMELALCAIPTLREVQIPVRYKGRLLKTFYRADFIRYDSIIVELKALASVGGTEEAQVLNYLKATGYRRALLLNFGAQKLWYKRLVLSSPATPADRLPLHLRSSAPSADHPIP